MHTQIHVIEKVAGNELDSRSMVKGQCWLTLLTFYLQISEIKLQIIRQIHNTEKMVTKKVEGGNIVKTPLLVINLSAERTKRHSCLTVLVTLLRLLKYKFIYRYKYKYRHTNAYKSVNRGHKETLLLDNCSHPSPSTGL